MNKKNIPLQISLILIIAAFFIMSVNKQAGIILIAAVIIFGLFMQRHLLSVIKGNKAYAAKDLNTALKNYKKASLSKNSNIASIRGYLLLELKHGNPLEAKNVLDKILSERKFSPQDMISLNVSNALILWKLGNMNEAINILKDLLKTEESNYIYETLTSLLLIDDKAEEALEYIYAGLSYDESNNILKSNLGEANYKIGNIAEAEETFSSIIDQNIQFIEPYYFYALILKEKGETEKAIEILEKSLTTNDSLLSTVSKSDAEKVLASLNSTALK